MSAAPHTFRTSCTFAIHDGSETEYALVIKYGVSPGSPELGAKYLGDPDGYDPGSPDELWIESVRAFRENRTEAVAIGKLLTLVARNDETLEETILDAWRSNLDSAPDPDHQREARMDGSFRHLADYPEGRS